MSAPSPTRTPLPPGSAWLEATDGLMFPLVDETRVGRGEGNEVRPESAGVSRRHAVIRRVGQRYIISDLGSTNGTYVNDEPVSAPRDLVPGDRVTVGEWHSTFQRSSADADADDPLVAVPGSRSATQFLGTLGSDARQYLEGDLRVVTVLFLDLHGFTAISETMTPDQVTLVMNQCFERLTSVVARYGGHVDKYVGDAMMVLFGAPVTHEDDAERAVRAAIELQAELGRFTAQLRRHVGVLLEMRVGINTGEVLAGKVGGGQFAGFTVMGDAVNLASRLEHAARVGHILVGESTYKLTRHAIKYQPQPPIAIKGKRDLVQTYEVLGLDEDLSDNEFEFDSAFVGRAQHSQVLREMLEAASAGIQVVTLTGDPGTGKTRLLAEAQRAHAADTHWVVARSHAYDLSVPFSMLHHLAQDAARVLGDDPSTSELLDLLRAERAAADAEARTTALAGALALVLGRLAEDRLLVLVLDGAQWADAESLAVLDATLALPQVADSKIVLLVSARTDWEHAWPSSARALRLECFNRQECAELIAVALRAEQAEVDPAVIDGLLERTGGNPLALAELLQAHVDGGGLARTPPDNRWRLAKPLGLSGAPGLRAVAQARLDTLQPGERRVLQAAAVVDRGWTSSFLQEVLEGELAVSEALPRLVALGLLVEEPSHALGEEGERETAYAFRHTTLRDAAYASIPQLEQRRLHEH
ncbi:MAG TPA: adenylate/guanylate cyclase domain-containing protein, partial [Nonomuraea sp.]|nr:adenylate/guanylate cyclase domain-containing protein [Nonomuraea sp.]